MKTPEEAIEQVLRLTLHITNTALPRLIIHRLEQEGYRLEYIGKPWNKNADQKALCVCGHPYYRHFDTYDDMYPIGCKYCACTAFEGQ